MRIELTSRNLSLIIGLNHQRGKGNASKITILLGSSYLFIRFGTLISILVFSYSDTDYFKQALRQGAGAPAKSREPRIPRMPQL